MDFGQWLVHKQWLARREYRDLMSQEFERVFSRYYRQGGFQSLSIDELGDDVEGLREIPFGQVLQGRAPLLEQVLQRSRKTTVGELIDEWYTWHRDHLEPICEYCLMHHMGRQLYERQLEKKLVARFLVDAKADNADTIVRECDVVLLLEGTSALYAGLAMSASKRRLTVRTSNSGLIREFRDNPAVQGGFEELFIIGGKAEPAFNEVEGNHSLDQYVKAITDVRHANLVLVPLTRLTPAQGPTAMGPAAQMRGEILIEAFKSRGLRNVVFIADHAKLLESDDPAGTPIFPGGAWPKVVQENKRRILIVTSPSPGLRQAHEIAQVYNMLGELDVARRNLDDLEKEECFESLGFKFSDVDRAYDKAAKALYRIVSDDRTPRFFEAYDPKGIGTRRVVFDLVALTISDTAFRGFLASAIGLGEESQLHIVLQGLRANFTVDVKGPAPLLEKILQIGSFANKLKGVFGQDCILRSVLIEGTNRGRSWSVSLPTLPVDRNQILRAAVLA